MAKTRSQTKKEIAERNKKESRTLNSDLKGRYNVKSCKIVLERIDYNELLTKLEFKTDAQVAVESTDEKKMSKSSQLPENFNSTHVTPQSSSSSTDSPQNLEITANEIKKPKQNDKFTQLVANTQFTLRSAKALRIWESLKKMQTNLNLKLNQIVCARMSGYRPWPGIVKKIKKNGIDIKFFGTNNIGPVKCSEILPFDLCGDMLFEYSCIQHDGLSAKSAMYQLSFEKACKEVMLHLSTNN